MSWLHNCTIITLIHAGSNYSHSTAATAHPCCRHVDSGSTMEPGKAMGVGKVGIPSSNASLGPAEILHFQVFGNTPIQLRWHAAHLKIQTFLYIWEFSVSREILATYTNTLFVYIQNISKDWLLNWPPSKFISFQTSPLSRSIHQVYSFMLLKYIPALGKDHEDFLRKLGQLP